VGQHERVLAIVHRRQEAEELARALGKDCLHLSARMCAEHRSSVLNEVRGRLQRGERCQLVATQLVEAGVDLDFPVVFRALAGLETLAQAAGRCNREMRLSKPGRFIVFRAPSKPPAKSLQRGLDESLDFFRTGLPDLADPDIFAKYTKLLLSDLGQDGTDTPQVLAHERDLNFPEVAARFRMIEDSGQPVVADYGDAWQRVLELRAPNGVSRQAFRRLQRYTVSLQPQEIARLQKLGVLERVEQVLESLGGQTGHWMSCDVDNRGARPASARRYRTPNPERLVRKLSCASHIFTLHS
jgi:CRISPR-associated endonuclease/helicase Cas3